MAAVTLSQEISWARFIVPQLVTITSTNAAYHVSPINSSFVKKEVASLS